MGNLEFLCTVGMGIESGTITAEKSRMGPQKLNIDYYMTQQPHSGYIGGYIQSPK